MTYIIFTLLHNLLDFHQVNLFKIAKHYNSFFTHYIMHLNQSVQYVRSLVIRRTNVASKGKTNNHKNPKTKRSLNHSLWKHNPILQRLGVTMKLWQPLGKKPIHLLMIPSLIISTITMYSMAMLRIQMLACINGWQTLALLITSRISMRSSAHMSLHWKLPY